MLRTLTVLLCLCLPMAAQATLYEFNLTSLTIHPDHPAPGGPDEPPFGPGDTFIRLDLPAGPSAFTGQGCLDDRGAFRAWLLPDDCDEMADTILGISYDLVVDGAGDLSGSMIASYMHNGIDVASVAPGLWRGTFSTDLWFPCFLRDDYPCAIEGVWQRVAAPAAVPEPGPLALMILGLGGLGRMLRQNGCVGGVKGPV